MLPYRFGSSGCRQSRSRLPKLHKKGSRVAMATTATLSRPGHPVPPRALWTSAASPSASTISSVSTMSHTVSVLNHCNSFKKNDNSSPSCLGPSNCIAKHHCMHSVVDGAIVSPHTYMHTCTLSLNLSMPTSLSNVLDSVRLHSGVLYYSVLPPPPRSPKHTRTFV